jgi:peptidyl-prolyl cis-trans isomerase A (cyclophilin A)
MARVCVLSAYPGKCCKRRAQSPKLKNDDLVREIPGEKLMNSKNRSLLFFALIAVFPLAARAQTPPASGSAGERAPGLYWTIQTDQGNIACKLYEKEAPLTVRTMVGLAIGKLSYRDPKTGQTMKKKFFDGLTFHRVIPMFMIQGGDPLGTGTGSPEGPGFPYKNESAPGLDFSKPGILAMANAGPGTNGSQFFVTEGPVGLAARDYTIWGQCDNVDVVKAIARVPRDANDRPRTPVVMRHVLVERVGPAPADAPEAVTLGASAPAAAPGRAPAQSGGTTAPATRGR